MLPTRLFDLIEELRSQSAEADWFEFKQNNADPDRVAERISALSNSARMVDRETAYIVWGIEDATHRVTGTTFDPASAKRASQPLQMWLGQVLAPCPHLQFNTFEHPDGRLVLLEIAAATNAPVAFNGIAHIRMGSATPKLTDLPEIQAALWAKLRPFSWEQGVAQSYASSDDILMSLDYAGYFSLTRQPLPDNRAGILEKLAADRLIKVDVGSRWSVTNLGALLFAQKLSSFPVLGRKAVRVVEYSRVDRLETRRRLDLDQGYAVGFLRLMDFIDGLVPRNEEIGRALREERSLYPVIAIRELVANAVIHQDLTVSGAGVLIEVFPDRMEITNPGKPLLDPARFLDLPPRSRNEALAALMRRMRMCEEQGSGVDKALTAVEIFQLPPPDFREDGDSTRVLLFGPRTFGEMSQAERVRACYQHAGLRFLANSKMTNTSLRQRFGKSASNAAGMSRVIREALDANLIKLADPNAPKSGYVPIWA